MKKDNEKLLINAGIVLLAYFGVIKPILNKLGVTKSATDRLIEDKNKLPNNKNPFSPDFYKYAPNGSKLIKSADATNLSKRIYDALGVFSDDEAAIYSVFRQLKSQRQVSILADKFQQIYKTDLLTYLQRGYSQWNAASGLNENEMSVVISIVDGLPKDIF